jgi:predicted metal-dependent hydrolase
MRKHTDPARPEIPVRRPRFSFPVERSRRWGGESITTLFAHALSPLFPAGERFFIRSVLAFRDRVSDPQLLEEIRNFVMQEGVHTAQHIRYDDSVQAHYDVKRMEHETEVILRTVSRVLARLEAAGVLNAQRMELAATVGLEHFTALLGEQLLLNRELFANADPEFSRLWFWHAVEEIEHKAVAFDVFDAVGGTYGERIVAFAIATVMIYTVMTLFVVRMMRQDGETIRPGAWLELLRWGLVEPGMFRQAARGYLDYLRPGFHPWDHDNRALIEEFKRAYAA